MVNRTTFAALILLIFTVGALGQQQNPSIAALLAQFKAPHWDTRADALDQIMKIPRVLQSSDVRDAIIALQEKEDIYIRTPGPTAVGDLNPGEGYGDQYSTNLVEALQIIAERFNDSRAVSALAASGYNPDSKLAGWLADRADAVPRLLEMIAHDNWVESANAAYVLAIMIDRDRRVGQKGVRSYAVMDNITQQTTLALIRASLNDPNPYKKDWVISSLAMIGDASDIPRLQAVAQNDKGFDEQTGRYFQREHAAKAIADIQNRVKNTSMSVPR